ncbi:MAG: efflux RND transporter periplasmic adaptor subunit [Bacteroidales bacterium]|nr:efflux RND transporter periplasmic adaptor subunit [Bacteroidales bacterium]
MKRIKIILGFVSLMFIANSCSESEAKNINEVVDTKKKTLVKVIQLEKEKINRKSNYTANLKAFEEVFYAPASPGHIKEIFVDVGTEIRKGDLIAMMDDIQLETAQLQLENAESNYKRLDTLYHLNSIPEQKYEMVKNKYEQAKANVNFRRENTQLTSPINGVVTAKYYEGGELYTGMPNTSVGKAAIVTIMQINPLKAIINIPERYFPKMKKGIKAQVKLDIYKEKTFEGYINKISPIIDNDSRTFNVELLINNDRKLLRPGMFSRVCLNIEEVEAIVVPAITILRVNGTNSRYVYIIDENNKARKVNVKILDRFDDKVEIFSENIKEGDFIVVAGQEKLNDGLEVLINK